MNASRPARVRTTGTAGYTGSRAQRYSLLALVRHAFHRHERWQPAWRSPEPKPSYDVVIIGAGGHGLATAYYLAQRHGIRNVAVLEKGWLGGGNTARNTAVVRSNYLLPENAMFYEHSLKLWEHLSQELNFNVMHSQRGVLNLAHSEADIDAQLRRGNAMRLNGIDAEFLSREEVRRLVPELNLNRNARFPVLGGLFHPRGGTARHDAVAWGFARAADALGVDIIQNCEVTGITRDGNRVTGVQTRLGPICAGKVAIVVAGSTSRVAAMAGLKLPIETHVLQAMVTEPVKPILHVHVSSRVAEVYVNQSDKGELVMGGNLDGHNSYAQRGNLPIIEEVVRHAIYLMPHMGRLRLLRMWGGLVDMTMDGSPIIGRLPIDNLYLNGGWCYGGFKATPGSGWVFAHTIAHDTPHPLNAPFALERFLTGRTLDEKGAGPFPALQ